jgi:Zn-dependent peptidase ImmA (M78 family)
VVINDQDVKTAWSFTLLHELAHLWIGANGVMEHSPKVAVRHDVASQFLLPTNELDRIGISRTSIAISPGN